MMSLDTWKKRIELTSIWVELNICYIWGRRDGNFRKNILSEFLPPYSELSTCSTCFSSPCCLIDKYKANINQLRVWEENKLQEILYFCLHDVISMDLSSSCTINNRIGFIQIKSSKNGKIVPWNFFLNLLNNANFMQKKKTNFYYMNPANLEHYILHCYIYLKGCTGSLNKRNFSSGDYHFLMFSAVACLMRNPTHIYPFTLHNEWTSFTSNPLILKM